ncbi:hypothetical protein OS493_026828 [Desmophyllum pertusum]|uniref:Uncharacterized protein n=1 Tax=Desmophyllum pertusum TaxID=174260 RepID=A0A9W9ZL59_9CNID|nr:hypothetical protein OS493_026828 [Desmophyllum pertusum]
MVSGVKCSWSNGGYLEVDLHNCHKPINYHVLFNAPGKHVFKNLTLQKGDEKVLYDGKVTVNLKVAELKREGNVVTTTVQLITCSKLPKLCSSTNLTVGPTAILCENAELPRIQCKCCSLQTVWF